MRNSSEYNFFTTQVLPGWFSFCATHILVGFRQLDCFYTGGSEGAGGKVETWRNSWRSGLVNTITEVLHCLVYNCLHIWLTLYNCLHICSTVLQLFAYLINFLQLDIYLTGLAHPAKFWEARVDQYSALWVQQVSNCFLSLCVFLLYIYHYIFLSSYVAKVNLVYCCNLFNIDTLITRPWLREEHRPGECHGDTKEEWEVRDAAYHHCPGIIR